MEADPPDRGDDLQGTSIDRHVGKQLQAIRQANGVSLGTIASTLGVSEAEVMDWENGISRVPAGHLLTVSQLLSCPVVFFFEGFNVPSFDEDPEPTELGVHVLFDRYSKTRH